MIDNPNLVPECNVDTVFVEMLGFKKPNHAPSITVVSSILNKKNPGEKVFGFVDDDKKKPKYLLEFELVDKAKNVTLSKHPHKEQYLVIVRPAMDKFIFDLCQDLGINLASYNLPRELEAFISITKRDAIKNNNGFKNLLNTISQRNAPEVAKIRSWIKKYYG